MSTLIDWMRHGLTLARDRLAHPQHGEDIQPIKLEVYAREFVLAHLGDELQGGAAIWWDYIVAHARLQIKRYAYEISEQEFFEACKALRRQRDEDLSVSKDVWLKDKTEL